MPRQASCRGVPGDVEREHHQRQVVVDDADEDRPGRVEDRDVTYPQNALETAGETIAAQDRAPRVGADEEARPERDDDEDDEQRLPATGAGREEVREWDCEDNADDGSQQRELQGRSDRSDPFADLRVVIELERRLVAARGRPPPEAENDRDCERDDQQEQVPGAGRQEQQAGEEGPPPAPSGLSADGYAPIFERNVAQMSFRCSFASLSVKGSSLAMTSSGGKIVGSFRISGGNSG